MKPKVIDLFAGVGGLSLGFENSGFDVVLAFENHGAVFRQTETVVVLGVDIQSA